MNCRKFLKSEDPAPVSPDDPLEAKAVILGAEAFLNSFEDTPQPTDAGLQLGGALVQGFWKDPSSEDEVTAEAIAREVGGGLRPNPEVGKDKRRPSNNNRDRPKGSRRGRVPWRRDLGKAGTERGSGHAPNRSQRTRIGSPNRRRLARPEAVTNLGTRFLNSL